LLEIAEDCFTLPHFARNGQTLHGPHCISGCVASWAKRGLELVTPLFLRHL
jgi:hypothetical protein